MAGRIVIPAIPLQTWENVFIARGRLRLLAVGASIVLILVMSRLLGTYLPSAGRELWHPHLGWLSAAVAWELISMGAFSELQRTVLRASGTRVSVGRMLGLTFEANAVSESLPAGSAFATGYSFRRFRTWGASAPGAGYTLLASGLLSALAFGLLAAVTALIAGAGSADPIPVALTGALLGVIMLSARQLRRHPAGVSRVFERVLGWLNRVRRRPVTAVQPRMLALVGATATIRPTARNWSGALLFAAINWAADLACLLAAGRAVGVGGAPVELAAIAYIAGISVSSISLVPGGLGIVEAAMVLTLVHGDLPRSGAIAIVLLYRIVSYLVMVVIGWSLWLIRAHHVVRPTVSEPPRDERHAHSTGPRIPLTVGKSAPYL